MEENIQVVGARENNLKNVNVTIPRNKMTVFTGVSGSGKSSLAFNTIFAEGQRRFVESLSSYARQFLGQMNKPDVDAIYGLSPAISIDQKTTSKNPRSTVGTITEIYDYMRLLFARIGVPHCPKCGKEIRQQTVDQICDKLASLSGGTKLIISSPVIRGKKGEYTKLLENFRKSGYIRVKVDGIIYSLDEEISLDKNIKHEICVVIDRLVVKKDMSMTRLTDSVENALKLSGGLVTVDAGEEKMLFSANYACPDCDISLEELTPRFFSFNSPFGACPECNGLGFKNEIDVDKIIKDPNLSLAEGAISTSGWNFDNGKVTDTIFRALAKHYNFSLKTPVKDLPPDILQIILYGTSGERILAEYDSAYSHSTYYTRFEGIINNLWRRYRETTSEYVKAEIEKYMKTSPCSLCHGKRLKKEALAVTVNGKNIAELSDMPIIKLYEFFRNLELNDTSGMIAENIIKEIMQRLRFLLDVGLSYLTLSRSAGTLSGGEAQRIRLATQIGSGLVGVLYILDEPSIGLHQRDNDKLLATLKKLRDLGNTLIVVEHDEDTVRNADYIVDVGPKAGIHGGKIVAQGTLEDIVSCPESITGQYLCGKKSIPIPETRRICDGRFLEVVGAKQNNLKNIDVKIPLGVITVITGVSGSGKSSLINGILYPELANRLNRSEKSTGNCTEVKGIEYLDKVINIDQSPIGRTPRSNPATYCGVFTAIRELFATTPDAKSRGYSAGRFSFNVKGGRCENCAGDGIIKIEMHFLPDVYVPCEVCKGKRYNRETLEVRYKGKNISEVLDMTVEEACAFFENIPSIYNKIKTLNDVGLGYVRLGQPATELSGGEAQRVKLATELAKRSTGKTVYILDEPTTGLHVDDVSKLVKILNKLVKNGNSVIIIEHNLEIIKIADHIIDLGPEGGDAGGTIVAEGTPEEIAANEKSYTGQFLKQLFEQSSVRSK